MLCWQQQGYLDRAIWHRELFTANALFIQESSSEGYQYGILSYQESKIFEDLDLDKKIWVPGMCKNLHIDNLMGLKEIESHRGKCSKWSYEYLVCIATLSLFGFDIDVSFFTIIPNEKQLEDLSSMLKENLEDLTGFHKIEEKQAYVLNIAMSNYFENVKVVPYILKKIPHTIPQELSIPSCGEKDLADLKKTINSIIGEKGDNAYKIAEKFWSMHFQSICLQKVPTTTVENNTILIFEPLKQFIQKLGLFQYYPQKLTHVAVMKLSEDALRVNEKPSTLPELPWYFMRNILALDSTVRETGSAVKTELENLEESEESEESGQSDESGNQKSVRIQKLTFAQV